MKNFLALLFLYAGIATAQVTPAIPNNTVLGNSSGVTAAPSAQPSIFISGNGTSSQVLVGGTTPAFATVPATAGGCLVNVNPNASVTNTACGAVAGTNITGTNNSAFGNTALNILTTGIFNTGVGYQAGFELLSGSYATIVGATAMFGNGGAQTTGNQNTAIGYAAMYGCQGACGLNTALGSNAGSAITTGSNNLYLGANVGTVTQQTGSNNILIGTSNVTDTIASGTINELNVNKIIIDYATLPTVTSGGGTSPSVSGNGTHVFKVTEGASGSPTTTLVLGMPTAPNDWVCPAVLDRTSASITARQSGAASTTAVTITFSSAPANSDVVEFICAAL